MPNINIAIYFSSVTHLDYCILSWYGCVRLSQNGHGVLFLQRSAPHSSPASCLPAPFSASHDTIITITIGHSVKWPRWLAVLCDDGRKKASGDHSVFLLLSSPSLVHSYPHSRNRVILLPAGRQGIWMNLQTFLMLSLSAFPHSVPHVCSLFTSPSLLFSHQLSMERWGGCCCADYGL